MKIYNVLWPVWFKYMKYVRYFTHLASKNPAPASKTYSNKWQKKLNFLFIWRNLKHHCVFMKETVAKYALTVTLAGKMWPNMKDFSPQMDLKSHFSWKFSSAEKLFCLWEVVKLFDNLSLILDSRTAS